MLSKLAWQTFSQGEYFFKQDKAERLIGEYIRNLPGANTDEEALRLDSEAVLKSIESQHGLLAERAKGIYSFSHLTFQEYFAARYIIVVRQSSDEALAELVSHLFDTRWREVFILAVAMFPNADKLVSLIKDIIDKSVSHASKIQYFLKWLYQISKIDYVSFCSLDQDAVEFIFKFIVSNHSTTSRVFHCFFNLNNILYFKAQNNPQIQFYIDSYLLIGRSTVGIDPYELLNGEDNLYEMIGNCIQNAKVIDKKLYEYLRKLKQKLPNRILVDKKFYRMWWLNNGRNWTDDLKKIMIKYQNICHPWNFTLEEKNVLKKCFDANQLLTHCLHQDCYISPEVRREIEETLLLPIAEIEKRKKQ